MGAVAVGAADADVERRLDLAERWVKLNVPREPEVTSNDRTTLVLGGVNVSRSATGPVTAPWMTSTRSSFGTNCAQFGSAGQVDR